MNKNILYIGPLNKNGTCFQRSIAFEGFFNEVFRINTYIYKKSIVSYYLNVICNKFSYWPDFLNVNKKVRRFNKQIDYVWVDKGLIINKNTLIKIKEKHKNIKLIHYSPDDMLNKGNQSVNYLKSIKIYDYHITTKSYNVKELYDLGVKNVLFIDNCFDKNYHVKIEKKSKKYDVGFIGSYELDRANILKKLAFSGVKLSIRGNWPKKWVKILNDLGVDIVNKEYSFPDYNFFVSQCKINLCFLRKINRDFQTTRSIEIPAMGGFMMAEDTKEHRKLFKENVEAVFFSSYKDLQNKVDYYLKNENLINKIANTGYNKCHQSGYSNQEKFKKLFKESIK